MKLSVSKKLGKLSERVYGLDGQLDSNINIEGFHAIKITNNVYSDYGQYHINTITLIDGSEDDIVRIGSYEFSKIIEDVHYFQLSNDSISRHTFSFNGRDNTGRIFEIKLTINSKETLPSIIYAIIFIYMVDNLSDVERFWNAMNGQSTFNTLPGTYLNDIIRVNNISKTIVTVYPFMEMFLQKGLIRMKAHLNELLAKIDILK